MRRTRGGEDALRPGWDEATTAGSTVGVGTRATGTGPWRAGAGVARVAVCDVEFAPSTQHRASGARTPAPVAQQSCGDGDARTGPEGQGQDTASRNTAATSALTAVG